MAKGEKKRKWKKKKIRKKHDRSENYEPAVSSAFIFMCFLCVRLMLLLIVDFLNFLFAFGETAKRYETKNLHNYE